MGRRTCVSALFSPRELSERMIALTESRQPPQHVAAPVRIPTCDALVAPFRTAFRIWRSETPLH